MKPEVVLALYKPHPGKDAELIQILKNHIPTLRRLELATDRPVVLVQTKNGSFLEIFEWSTAEAADLAHHHPEVAKVWEAIGKVADFTTLESLEEIKQPFPHFKPINLDS
jgi:hypothetical protein